MKLVKIVVTTGPSLEDLDKIREAAKAGADVFRLTCLTVRTMSILKGLRI